MLIAIISAAGQGSRLGSSIPKQFIAVNNEPIYISTIKKFLRDDISRILLMIQPEYLDMVVNQLKQYLPYAYNENKIIIEIGGETAEETRFNALKYLKDMGFVGNVIFHDAVRPNVNYNLISNVINNLQHFNNVVPTIICKDSMLDSNNNIIQTAGSKRLQTPQGFEFDSIYNCYNNCEWKGSPALTFLTCYNSLYTIDGDESNFKITTIDDVELYKKIIQ